MDQAKNIGSTMDKTGYMGPNDYVNPIATPEQKVPLADRSTPATDGVGIGLGLPNAVNPGGLNIGQGLGQTGALPADGTQPMGKISAVPIQLHQEKHNNVGA